MLRRPLSSVKAWSRHPIAQIVAHERADDLLKRSSPWEWLAGYLSALKLVCFCVCPQYHAGFVPRACVLHDILYPCSIAIQHGQEYLARGYLGFVISAQCVNSKTDSPCRETLPPLDHGTKCIARVTKCLVATRFFWKSVLNVCH